MNTKNTIDVSIQKQVEEEAEKTASLFRTAYIIAKNNRPCTDYQDLVVLRSSKKMVLTWAPLSIPDILQNV